VSTDERSRVALARCKTYEPEAVREALRSVLAPFGGMQRFARPGARVILKPNYVQGRPAERAANTHPVFIVAVAQLVRECGGRPGRDPRLEARLVEGFALREHLDKELFRLSTGTRRKLALVAAFAAGASNRAGSLLMENSASLTVPFHPSSWRAR